MLRFPLPALSRLKGRLLADSHRLAFAWRAFQHGEGRGVRLRRDDHLIRLADASRQIVLPHPRRAHCFKDGIDARLERVASKYVGGTGYVPRHGDLVVDIGAGIGEFAIWCADAGARVIAFEPDPLAFQCLERNTASLPEVSALPYALWKERASLRLHGSLDTSESSLVEDGFFGRLTDITAWPLDEITAIGSEPVIDFMKVDGEGVEPEILAGAVRTLRRTRVLAVDIGAGGKRPDLVAKIDSMLEALRFRPVAHDGDQTVLAVNTAMVGPFSSRVLGRPGS